MPTKAKLIPIDAHGLSDAQIERAVSVLRGVFQRHRREFGTSSLEALIQSGVYQSEFLRFVRGYMEADTGLAARTAFVDARPLDQWLRGRPAVQIDKTTRPAIPKAASGEAIVYFFRIRKDLSSEELMQEYEFHGLIPANPFQLMAVNAAEQDFSDTHPNVTVWQDGEGTWHQCRFCRLEHLRSAFLIPVQTMHSDLMWYAGVKR